MNTVEIQVKNNMDGEEKLAFKEKEYHVMEKDNTKTIGDTECDKPGK